MRQLDDILRSPRLPDYYEQIKNKLEEEKKKRKDFLESIDEDTNAEFINGEVVYHSPVSLRHSLASNLLYRLLSIYVDKNDLGFVSHEKIMLDFRRNNYEPDIAFWRKEIAKNFKPDQLLFPPPDFIAEILSPSTEMIDRKIKFEDYAYHRVQEYWIIDPEKEQVEQFINNNGKFSLVKLHKSGDFITSFTVRGFKIPVSAVFDEQENLRFLKIL